MTVFTDNFDRTTLGSDWTAIHYDGAGSVSLDGSRVTVNAGSGGDFWRNVDGGSLIYHSIDAPQSNVLDLQKVVAEVKSSTLSVAGWNRAFMLREDASATSANICLAPDDEGYFGWTRRTKNGVGTDSAKPRLVRYNAAKPIWMKLEWLYNTCTASVKQGETDSWALAWVVPFDGFVPTMICLCDTVQGAGISYDDFSVETSVITVVPRVLQSPTQYIAQAIPPGIYTVRGRAVAWPRSAGDQHFGGRGYLTGTIVDADSNPVSRKVLLYDRRANLLLHSTWSKADGTYRFDDLDPTSTYVVLAHDYTGQYNAVVADNVTPEVA